MDGRWCDESDGLGRDTGLVTHVFGGDGRNLGMRREIQFLFPVLKFDYHLSRHFASLFICV